jgi:hypothetical protein
LALDLGECRGERESPKTGRPARRGEDDDLADVAVEQLYGVHEGASRRQVIDVDHVSPSVGADTPLLVDGARACPPEDCGGAHGYAHLLDALGDPDHEEHAELPGAL